MKRHDALVIGGGPAGATAAVLLARAGGSVAVVEKIAFPRPKVCGEYISATTWPLLRELGVAESLAPRAGPAVRRVGFFAGDTAIDAPMPHGGGEWGRALGRDLLDPELLERAREAGAEVLQPWAVRELQSAGGGFIASIVEAGKRRRAEVRARIVIDAHGSWERDPLRPASREAARDSDLLGFKARFLDAKLAAGLMPLVLFPGGYGGMVQSDSGRVSFSCCIRRDSLARCRREHPGLAAGEAVMTHAIESCRGVRETLAGARRDAPWLSAGPIRPGIRALAQGGLFAVGNAAGEAHPLVAEGISMAIQSSWLLCEGLAGSRDLSSRAIEREGREYAARWRRHLSTRIHAAGLFAAFTSRPAGARASVEVLKRIPRLLTLGASWSGKAHALGSALPRGG